jgi:hypothetical protein
MRITQFTVDSSQSETQHQRVVTRENAENSRSLFAHPLRRTFDAIVHGSSEQLSPEFTCVADEQHGGKTVNEHGHPTRVRSLLTGFGPTQTKQYDVRVA